MTDLTRQSDTTSSSFGNRVFFRISNRGCGSGCTYCYISHPRQAQELLSSAEVGAACDALVRSPTFVPGRTGTIISLAPETEPFKSANSALLTLQVINTLSGYGNPIQVSTKELVDESVYEQIDRSCQFPGQVLVFTSITSLHRSKYMEPDAPLATRRFLNFHSTNNRNFRTCLYIKPFIRAILKDYTMLCELLAEFPPSAICIGMLYVANGSRQLARPHPVHPSWRSPGVTDEMLSFRHQLIRDTTLPIFFNSTCVSSYFADREPAWPIWEDERLCVRCRSCGSASASFPSSALKVNND